MGRLTGIVALLLATACFEPQIRDAQISCQIDEICPGGFVCLDGLCRSEAPDRSQDAGSDPDGGSSDAPMPGPKVYELSNGSWTATPAATFLAGSTLNPAAVATAWSFCDGSNSLRCFGDGTTIACHDGTAWGKAPWSEIEGALTNFGATYVAAFTLEGGWALDVKRGEDWRGYEGPALSSTGGALTSNLDRVWVSGDNIEDMEQEFGDDPNAPTFDDVVADYIDVSKGGDPWSFLSANGDRFTIRTDSPDTTKDKEPTLTLPNAPLAADIKAALYCNGKLVFYAAN